MKTVCKTL